MGTLGDKADKSLLIDLEHTIESIQNEPKSEQSKQNDKEEIDRRVEQIVMELGYLKSKFPDSPVFLGKNIAYPQKKKGLIFGAHKLPNLVDLRDEINRFTENKELTNPRKKIKKLLKKFPYYADLRALNGIQIMNDAAQSGLSEKKLEALENSLIEIAKALYNGGLSIFNATWFIKIYLRYLEFLKERILREHSGISGHYHWKIQKLADALQKDTLKIASLISVKDKLGGLVMLNSKLKGSVYISECISKEEIKAACSAVQHDENKAIGIGKTANYVVLVVITLSLLFARIPILSALVKDTLKTIPDVSKDMILQKHMISTMMAVTDYQLELASGKTEKIRTASDKLYKRCLDIINQHLDFGIMSKPHEVDPFLKAAWVVKESNGFYPKKEYRKRLERVHQLLKVVMENSERVKGSYDLARQLQSNINAIMTDYGWTSSD
ncbi:MAG: hypothetical protein GY866_37000 [Proteobacteria bacterium]|nr:hypothetical protein [Pseudomonadota bacterium]